MLIFQVEGFVRFYFIPNLSSEGGYFILAATPRRNGLVEAILSNLINTPYAYGYLIAYEVCYRYHQY